jgi:ERCC4-related helicase
MNHLGGVRFNSLATSTGEAAADLLGQHGPAAADRLSAVCGSCYLQRQREAVDRFRRGEVNVLICTNIGSEGMDFRRCQVWLIP